MKRKAIALLIAVTMILWTAAPSFAAADTREISASYSGITLYIDLAPVTLLDANGNTVAPFIADGTTYLPVRAISEALGMDVVWEADTKSVRISEKSKPTDTVEADKPPAADEPAGDATETASELAKDAAATEEATDTEATGAAEVTEEPTDTEATGAAEVTEEPTDTEATGATEEAAEPFIGTKALSVTYSDIAIYVNDAEISPKDAGGNAVEPFIADGTTYLPVRAVAEALGLTVSWNGATKSIYVGEQPESVAAPAADAAYAKYLAAEEAIEAADSYAIEIGGATVITIDGKKTETKQAGVLKLVKHSDTDIEFISDMTVTIAGEDTAASVYYKDGVLYMESGGDKIKMALPLEAALAQVQTAGVRIETDAVKEQSIDGDTITFTLDGKALSDAVDTALSSLKSLLPASGSYTYGDAVCTVTLDEKGALKDFRTVFSLDLTIEGDTAALGYDFTMRYTQVGGVSITAPADLSSYKDAASETK